MQDVRNTFRASAPMAEALALQLSGQETSVCPVSARTLADNLAALCCTSSSFVLKALNGLPKNLLVLLQSPEGWTALSGYVSADLDCGPVAYAPTVH